MTRQEIEDRKRIPRFWAKVEKTDTCWLWTGKRNRDGYGLSAFHYRCHPAHRVVWEMTYGPIPEGLRVCHHCDNPPCVRPDHLFLGTDRDNAADRHQKGRDARGERITRARLTAEQVRAIRARFAEGDIRMRDLATIHNIHPSAISRILAGRRWQHLG